MKRRRFLTVTVGVMVLSLGGCLGVTQNCDKNIPSASHFTTVFTGAVRDNNTGVVWEQAPDATPMKWSEAILYCINKKVQAIGGTRGWRLPSVVELASVQVLTLPAPFVPVSVFTNVQSGSIPGASFPTNYWSATKDATQLDTIQFFNVWVVSFRDGNGVGTDPRNLFNYVWCVRGGMNADQY